MPEPQHRIPVGSPLVELTLVRLREFVREPEALFWVFGFPLLLALGLGIAFRNRPPESARVGVLRAVPAAVVSSLDSASGLVAVPLKDDSAGASALRNASHSGGSRCRDRVFF